MTKVSDVRLHLGDIGTQARPTRLSQRIASTGASAGGERSSSGEASDSGEASSFGGASASVEVSATHPDARRAFLRARQLFIAGERIDMGELAAELGVERTSLFRWVGNRDELLSEVLWSLAVPTLNHLDQSISVHGAARLSAVLTGFVDALIDADYFRTFLRREPARALRLLTSKESEMQRRFIAVVEVLVSAETASGHLDLPLPSHEIASLLARMVESFSYSDLLTGEPPSAERARAAFDFVLRP